MQKCWDLFLELVRVAIGSQEMLSKIPSDKEWHEMFDFAYQQTLVAICFSGIERLPQEQRPSRELLLQWYAITDKIERQNKLMNEHCQQALNFFRDVRFHPTILKGQGMAKLYEVKDNKGNIWTLEFRRQCGDIDIWLDGGRKRVYKFAKQLDPKGQLHGVNYHHVHFQLFDDVEVETHIYPGFLHNPFANRRLHKFFESHPSESMSDYPDHEFNIIFILLHCFNHLLGHGVGLRQVMDYYFVLKETPLLTSPHQGTEIGVANTLKELGMLRFAHGMMWVMQEVFRLEEEYLLVEPAAKEGRFILNEIFQTGNMGHHDKRHWGSLRTPLSRYLYNLRRDWHFLSHYPQEVLWKPLFSLWLFAHQKLVWR